MTRRFITNQPCACNSLLVSEIDWHIWNNYEPFMCSLVLDIDDSLKSLCRHRVTLTFKSLLEGSITCSS